MDTNIGAAAPASTGSANASSEVSQSQGGSSQGPSISEMHKAASAPSASAPEEIFEIKVNNRTVKMTRQEMIDHASMSHAANEKFNEAKKLRKEHEEKEKKYSSDPIKAFLDYANSLPPEQKRKALEEYYYKEFLEADTLTAEEKKMREREAKMKEWEQAQEEKRQKDEQDEDTKLTNQQREFLQGQIIEAMEASGLPKTKFFVSRMAFYMRQNTINGWNAPKEMIVRQVLNERQDIMSDMSEGATAEQLIKLLGDGVINKIRKHDLEQLRARRGQFQQPATSSRGAGTGVIDSGERLSSSDVQKRLNDIKQGKLW